VQAAGFTAGYVHNEGLYKVHVTGIQAAHVQDAASKLGALGFGEIWIRE
jgi:hypothetical protein